MVEKVVGSVAENVRAIPQGASVFARGFPLGATPEHSGRAVWTASVTRPDVW